MAQDVGPILEMVTERYLLRSDAEWAGRQQACEILDEIVEDLRAGDVRAIGSATQRNFDGPIQTIIPWASNLYTETLIQRSARAALAMRSGDSGCWAECRAAGWDSSSIRRAKPRHRSALATLMREVSKQARRRRAVCHGTGRLRLLDQRARNLCRVHRRAAAAILPDGYYNLMLPLGLRKDQRLLSACERSDLERFSSICHGVAGPRDRARGFLDRLLPHDAMAQTASGVRSIRCWPRTASIPSSMSAFRRSCARDISGLRRIGFPSPVQIEDVSPEKLFDARRHERRRELRKLGEEALASGAVAVVTLGGGAGSRWTQRRGRGEGAESILPAGGKAPHISRSASGKEPARRPALWLRSCPM